MGSEISPKNDNLTIRLETTIKAAICELSQYRGFGKTNMVDNRSMYPFCPRNTLSLILNQYNRLFAWRYPQNCLFLHINVDMNSMEKKEYRNRIRVILAEKMITNTYLAEQLGVSKMTISRWCTNTTQPSAPQLIEISQILQCDLKDLYEMVK